MPMPPQAELKGRELRNWEERNWVRLERRSIVVVDSTSLRPWRRQVMVR
jgi:hypothetical protein